MTHRLRSLVAGSIAATLFPVAALHAQSEAGSVARDITGQFDMGPQVIVNPWRLQIAARHDGWVELVLESVPAAAPRLPWLVSSSRRTLGEPIRTRAIISPAAAVHTATTLDSLLGYRVTDGANAVTLLRLDSIPNSRSMFYAFAHEVFAPRGTQRDTIASATFVGCIGWPEAPVMQQGSGLIDVDIGELRRLGRSIREAAALAARHRMEPAIPSETSAAAAGCAARPIAGNPIPGYPNGQWDRFGTQHVRIGAIIDTTGRIDPSSIEVTSGVPPFVELAKEAIRGWRFYPAMRAPRVPLRQRTQFEVLFAQSEPRTVPAEAALRVVAGEHGTDVLIIAQPPGK